MLKRLAAVLFLVSMGAVLWIAGWYYPQAEIDLAFQTVTALTGLYILAKLIVEEIATRRISDEKTRYMFRKAVSVLSIAAAGLIILGIWVQDPTALAVAYGLIGAGVALSLQDVFKNFAGGIILFLKSPYHVGDRIEVRDTYGDVIDIGLMYTRLLEIRGWVEGDQATGRIITVPNSAVLTGTVNNYTENNTFIWDEITIPITYDSDWESARDLFTGIAEEATREMATRADEEISNIRKKYYLSRRETEPQVFLELTDNWVTVHLRYITDTRERRRYHNTISQNLLTAIDEAEDITVASETLDIVGFPDKEQ